MSNNVKKEALVGENILFFNLGIVLELASYKKLDLKKANPLKYYDNICETKLEDDIKYSEKDQEQEIINDLCDLEKYHIYYIGEKPKKRLREKLNLSYDRERTLFTKIFVKDYLYEVGMLEKRDLPDDITAVQLFKEFASEELKNDYFFAETILKLNDKYMDAMGDKVKENKAIQKIIAKKQ